MKNLLVTGGAGFIGSNFVQYILEHSDTVRVLNLDLLTYAGNLANLKGCENDERYHLCVGIFGTENYWSSCFWNMRLIQWCILQRKVTLTAVLPSRKSF